MLLLWNEGSTGLRLESTASLNPAASTTVAGAEEGRAVLPMKERTSFFRLAHHAPAREVIRVLADHSGPVAQVAFSADGEWLLTFSADHQAKLWRGSDASLVRTHG